MNNEIKVSGQLQLFTKAKDQVISFNPNQKRSKIRKRYMMPRIVAFIPAHNEEKSIRDCLSWAC